MGYDAFGLPAWTICNPNRQHPAITTEQNIARYREQLDNIGFSFDWSRGVRTSDPSIINGHSGFLFSCFMVQPGKRQSGTYRNAWLKNKVK